MTDVTPVTTPTRSPQPPEWLFKRVINPTMKTILRSPLHGILSKGLLILTFTGRKSGKRFSTPVAYHWLDAQTLVVLTRSKWWKNFQNGEPITVRVQGKTYPARAEIIHDNQVVWDTYIDPVLKESKNPREVGIMIPPDSTPQQIREAASDMLAVKIQLQNR